MLRKGSAKSATINALDKFKASATWARVMSPENYGTPYLTAADVTSKGHLSMQDYNWWSRSTLWTTYYIAPGSAGSVQGVGTFASPYVLYDGNEYDFNAFIRPKLDAHRHVECIFLDGTYTDVRLQIVKAGSNGNVISLQDPVADPTLDGGGLPSYTVPSRRAGSTFIGNSFYTMGASATGKLVLRALNPGAAIFESVKWRTHKNCAAEALRLSGAYHQGSSADYTFSGYTNYLDGVVVTGLTFRHYTNGVMIGRARNIAVKNCTLEDTGNRDWTGTAVEEIGVAGFNVSFDSQIIAIKNNVITDSWNTTREDRYTALSATDNQHQIHAFYHQYSKDVLYLDNEVTDCSGAPFKVAYTAHFSAGVIDSQYAYGDHERRTFVINNVFRQTKGILGSPHETTSTTGIWNFVHDNTVEKQSNPVESDPMNGMVIAGNSFSKSDIAALADRPFLTCETINNTSGGRLPNWHIEKNTINGVTATGVLMGHVRGTSNATLYGLNSAGILTSASLHTTTAACFGAPAPDSSSAIAFAKAVLAVEVASPDASRDTLMQSVLTLKGIPGLDLPA